MERSEGVDQAPPSFKLSSVTGEIVQGRGDRRVILAIYNILIIIITIHYPTLAGMVQIVRQEILLSHQVLVPAHVRGVRVDFSQFSQKLKLNFVFQPLNISACLTGAVINS